MSKGLARLVDAHRQSPEPASLAEVLLASLESLAAAGLFEEACTLAGYARAAVRQTDADAWQRFNALLHRLARHVT